MCAWLKLHEQNSLCPLWTCCCQQNDMFAILSGRNGLNLNRVHVFVQDRIDSGSKKSLLKLSHWFWMVDIYYILWIEIVNSSEINSWVHFIRVTQFRIHLINSVWFSILYTYFLRLFCFMCRNSWLLFVIGIYWKAEHERMLQRINSCALRAHTMLPYLKMLTISLPMTRHYNHSIGI